MFLAQQPDTTSYGLLVLKTFGVLAAIALLAWVLVRFVAPRLRYRTGKPRMQVLERLSLEPRRSLYLVEVDGRQMVIGVAEGGINLIKETDEGPTDRPGAENPDGPPS